MKWWLIVVIVGIVLAVVLWAIFVYTAVRETKAEVPTASFKASLDVESYQAR